MLSQLQAPKPLFFPSGCAKFPGHPPGHAELQAGAIGPRKIMLPVELVFGTGDPLGFKGDGLEGGFPLP
jgi:hypothetical protein